jgi:hypothetical protein
MASKLLSALSRTGNSAFTNLFQVIEYDKDSIAQRSLDIWKEISIKLSQEEKSGAFIYVYHKLTAQDTFESISQKYYQNNSYWFLIPLVNENIDIFDFPNSILSENEASIKIIKPEYLNKIFNSSDTDLTNFLGLKNVQ